MQHNLSRVASAFGRAATFVRISAAVSGIFLGAAFVVASPVAAAPLEAVPNLIRAGAQDWLYSAESGRADMWLIGDSIAGNLDAGLTAAAAKRYGIAGTGLGVELSGGATAPVTPSWAIGPAYPLNANGWSNAASAVPVDRQNYVMPFGSTATAGATPATGYNFSVVAGGYLDPNAAYDWHVYTASTDAGGSMRVARGAAGPDNYARLYVGDPVATATPDQGLQHTVFHLPAVNVGAGQNTGGQLENVTNTSVLYSRVVKPGASGVTLTTWGYGGHTAGDMYHDWYTANGTRDQQARADYLTAMTDAGTGKLMVVLEEGTNDFTDARAATPSVHGLLPGNGVPAIADNIDGLMEGIRGDWAAAGKDPADLSFLVLGMYAYDVGDAGNAQHRDLTVALSELAAAHDDTSFVDLWSMGPDWSAANAAGYMIDAVHPTILGGQYYGEGIFQALGQPAQLPEPTTALLLAAAPIALLRRRR